MTRLLHELERRDGRYGLETMCCGAGSDRDAHRPRRRVAA